VIIRSAATHVRLCAGDPWLGWEFEGSELAVVGREGLMSICGEADGDASGMVVVVCGWMVRAVIVAARASAAAATAVTRWMRRIRV